MAYLFVGLDLLYPTTILERINNLAKKKTSLVEVTGFSASTVKALQYLTRAVGDLNKLSGRESMRYLKHDKKVLGLVQKSVATAQIILANKSESLSKEITELVLETEGDRQILPVWV